MVGTGGQSITFIIFKYQQKQSFYMFILSILSIWLALVSSALSQCCLQIQGRSCLKCPSGTHMYRANCIIDVDNCVTYKDGFDCQTCAAGYQLTANGDCMLIPPPPALTPPQYTDQVFDPKLTSGTNADAFSLSVDYFKSSKAQLKTAQPIAAQVRTYKNLTVEVTIQFQDANKYYRGVIQPDLNSFIFKQISFSTIPSPTLMAAGVRSVDTATNTSTTPVSQNIDLKNAVHKERLALLEAQAKKQNPNINTFDSGRITTNPTTGTSEINANFTGTAVGDIINVMGTVAKDKKVTVTQVKLVVVGKPILGAGFNFVAFDTGADELFPILQDFSSQMPKYAGLQPTRTLRSAPPSSNIIMYKQTYTIQDGSTWQVVISLNTDLLLLNVASETNITPPTKTVEIPFTKVEPAVIWLDFNFIIVQEYINKQSNNKYKDAVIRSLEKLDDGTLIKYRGNYETGGFVWEVLAQITKTTFVTSGYQETRKGAAGNVLGLTNNGTVTTPNATTTTTTTANTTTNTVIVHNVTTTSNTTISTTANMTENPPKSNSSASSGPATAIGTPPATTNTTPNSTTTTTPNTTTTPKSTGGVSPKVLQNVNGLTQLAGSQMNGAEFKDIDAMLRSVNTKELTGAEFVGAYYSTTSFTRNYKIYYQKSPLEIYEAKVSRDNLRKRTYVIGFTRLP